MSPAAVERSLGDGGAAATRPEARRAGKPGSPGKRRSPGTAGTPPTPPGEPPLRRTTSHIQSVPPAPTRSPSVPHRLPLSVATITTRWVVLGGPSVRPSSPLALSPFHYLSSELPSSPQVAPHLQYRGPSPRALTAQYLPRCHPRVASARPLCPLLLMLPFPLMPPIRALISTCDPVFPPTGSPLREPRIPFGSLSSTASALLVSRDRAHTPKASRAC